jgi:hypothetical protein
MRPRLHRQNLVVWKSSARPVGRYGVPRFTGLARINRIRWWIRTGALLAVIGLMRLMRAVRARRGATLLLTGAALTVPGMILPDDLPSGAAFIVGMLVFLRGVAVTLGVSEPQRRNSSALFPPPAEDLPARCSSEQRCHLSWIATSRGRVVTIHDKQAIMMLGRSP